MSVWGRPWRLQHLTDTTSTYREYLFTHVGEVVVVTVNGHQVDVFPDDGPVLLGSCTTFQQAVTQWVEEWA